MPDIERIRSAFPLLAGPDAKSRLIYFDNACTTLKPQSVIDATVDYYRDTPVCGGRSVHRLGEAVTDKVATARRRLGAFLGAREPEEVVFTKNATEAINLVASGTAWRPGDVVVTTEKEHNSNWVPWLRLARTRGIDVVAVPTKEDGTFDLAAYERAVTKAGDRLRLVTVAHVSNADGVENPVPKIADIAHAHGARVLVDAAQSLPHQPLDVRTLGADFLAASGHKMLGPSGLGFLWGHGDALAELEPLALGGGTVDKSGPEGYSLEAVPERFEAGLQNYAALAALPAAIDFIDRLGRDWIRDRDRMLNAHATKRIEEMEHVFIHGPAPSQRGSILPFTVVGVGPHDVALYLDNAQHVAVRSGAHCVNSYFEKRGLEGWVRASFYFYNRRDEIDLFAESLAELTRGVRAASPRRARA